MSITRRWTRIPRGRRAADLRSRIAGEDLRLSAEGAQKLLALALDQSTPWISMQVHGDPTGVTARFYEALDREVEFSRRTPKLNPGALIVGALLHLGGRLVQWSRIDLRDWMREALRWETITEAREDVGEMDVVAMLESLPDEPTPEQAAEALEVVRRWRRDAQREAGWAICGMIAGRELERRLQEVVDGGQE